jgi:predicted DCC family thiol-disulfide oxidoreductase YuxK
MADRPTLVYDDDCGFCTWWARWASRNTDVALVGFSALGDAERARLPDDYEECVHLLTDEGTYSCGEAVERVLGRAEGTLEDVFAELRDVPGYEQVRERFYRFNADRRDLWAKLVREDPPARTVEIPVSEE